jgi:RimJ/RimL family protein N-acetyltransferase
MMQDGSTSTWPSTGQDASIRIELRPWQEDDLPLMQAIMGDPRMTEYLGGPESPEKLCRRLDRYVHSRAGGSDHMSVIVVGSQRQAAGSVGYWEKHWQDQDVWETGWHVLPAFQGRGIATRATAIVVERARASGLHRFMHAFPSIHNAASNAVCRRLGFSLQGEADFEFPPGHWMRCNDWRLDLHSTEA